MVDRSTAPPDPRWVGWWRTSGPVAFVAAVLSTAGMTRSQAVAVALLVVFVGTCVTVLVATSSDHVPWVGAVGWSVWGFAALGLLTWAPAVAAVLAVLVASTTPPVRNLAHVPDVLRPHRDAPALSDRDLLRQWSDSARALRLSEDRPEHVVRIVTRRAALLEEIERRGLLHRCRPQRPPGRS